MNPILKEGKNCWRIRKAGRVAFLVDGAAYFDAFARAAARAKRSILIACWDIDSRIRLFHEKQRIGLPSVFWEFINTVIKREKNLHIHILEWDYAVIYAIEREIFPVFKLPWQRNKRLHILNDSEHPTGGSHHQKVVVIDDRIAFAGGLDFTRSRWDTPEHLAEDPRRIDPSGKPYGPFHDVQMAVDSDVAASLGDMFRMRWQRVAGETLEPPGTVEGDSWPPELSPDLEDVDVAVVRTDPAHNGREQVREVETLYLDTIDSAKRYIYIENQYFSSFSIGRALAASLAKKNGPEIVIVLRGGSDWLEEATMGAFRAKLLADLRAADAYGRLRVYYPDVPGLNEKMLNLHSKVMIADGVFVRVGSSNLSNRSMGVDTECDLALESSGNKRIEKAILDFQNRLLSEHLGISAKEMGSAMAGQHSLISIIERLRGSRRTLLPFPEEEISWTTRLIYDSSIDPVEPIDPEKMIEEFVPEDMKKNGNHRLHKCILFLLGLFCLAVAWRWSSLGEWIGLDTLAAAGERLRENAFTPIIVPAVYVFGSLAMFPVTLLIVITVFTFGFASGFMYSLTGCVLAAVATYWLGQALGRDMIGRVFGTRINRVSRRLARHGVIAVWSVRIIPIASFTLVNLVAGANRIRFIDFVWGSILGMAPGIAAMSLFVYQLKAAIRDPGLGGFAILAVLAVAMIVSIFLIRSKLARGHEKQRPE